MFAGVRKNGKQGTSDAEKPSGLEPKQPEPTLPQPQQQRSQEIPDETLHALKKAGLDALEDEPQSRRFIAFLITAAVVLIGGIVFVLLFANPFAAREEDTGTETVSSVLNTNGTGNTNSAANTTSTEILPGNDWLTFTQSVYQFSVQYPPDWLRESSVIDEIAFTLRDEAREEFLVVAPLGPVGHATDIMVRTGDEDFLFGGFRAIFGEWRDRATEAVTGCFYQFLAPPKKTGWSIPTIEPDFTANAIDVPCTEASTVDAIMTTFAFTTTPIATNTNSIINGNTNTSVNENVNSGPQIDTDRDGLTDDRELELGTNPLVPDTDNDGLGDFQEVVIYNTDPLDPDTDNDGFLDGLEVKNNFNPLGPGTITVP